MRRRAVDLPVIALAVALAAAWVMAVTAHEQRAPGGQATVAASTSARVGSGTDMVGAAACGACHMEVRAAWATGRHSKMIQKATTKSVLGDFRQTDLRLRGRPYRLRLEGGAYYITESRLSGAPLEHRVDYTLGSRRIQHYLAVVDHGRVVVLPPTWDVQRGQWFDSVEIIQPDAGDARVVQQWNKNCVGCHVSGQDNGYDPATKTYATTWIDEGTTCERCHGPGRAHVERYRRAAPAATASASAPAIVRPTTLTPARSSAVCAQCHSLRDVIFPGFRAGAAYDDHFVLKLEYTPRKEQDPVYWADGRPRRFSNDAAGLWQSRCYLEGGVTCATCHDPHRPNVDRHAALANTNNALCTRCHQPIGRQLTAHTRHQASSAGSACVECHMPREVVSIKATMRDHTIGLPTPENTVAHGIPNACTTCHTAKPASWAVETMAAWWPNGRRGRNVARAAAFSEARAGKPDALPKLLAIAGDATEGPLARANALGYLRSHTAPSARLALEDALASGQPLLRMVAASSVSIAAAQPALERALEDSSRAVRVSALVSLVNLGTPPATAQTRALWRRVGEEFAAQAALHEDDATSQTDLGLVHLLNGDLERASRALEISIDLAPRAPRTAFLLGLTRLNQGRIDDARALLRRVPDDDPYVKVAKERLRRLDGDRR